MASSSSAGQDVSYLPDRRAGRSWLLIGWLLCVGAARSTRMFELMCLLLLCDRVSCCANGTVFMVCFAVDVSATLGVRENRFLIEIYFSLVSGEIEILNGLTSICFSWSRAAVGFCPRWLFSVLPFVWLCFVVCFLKLNFKSMSIVVDWS